MRMSRITLLAIAVLGAVIALDEDSIIFNIVSFAWAGFGATFGPVVILSLFWRGTSRRGAIAGMLSGAAMVFIWKFLISLLGGVFGIYELLPAFLVSLLFIIVFSRLEGGPGEDIGKEFDEVAAEVLG